MIEKLFYHLMYESHRAGIDLPLAEAVHRLSPGSSGQSALQHLARFRDQLIAEGHLVPPLLGKRNVKHDPNIRGYIRDLASNDPYAVRTVTWDEKTEDPKENFEINDGIIRGSGRYKRGNNTGVTPQKPSKNAKRRNRNPTGSRERTPMIKAYHSDEEGEGYSEGEYKEEIENDANEKDQNLQAPQVDTHGRINKYNLRRSSKTYCEILEEDASESESELILAPELELDDGVERSLNLESHRNEGSQPLPPPLTPVSAESEANISASPETFSDGGFIKFSPCHAVISEDEWESPGATGSVDLEQRKAAELFFQKGSANRAPNNILYPCGDTPEYTPRMSYTKGDMSGILDDTGVNIDLVDRGMFGQQPRLFPTLGTGQTNDGIQNEYLDSLVFGNPLFSQKFVRSGTADYAPLYIRPTDVVLSPTRERNHITAENLAISQYQQRPTGQFGLFRDSFESRSSSSDSILHRDDIIDLVNGRIC